MSKIRKLGEYDTYDGVDSCLTDSVRSAFAHKDLEDAIKFKHFSDAFTDAESNLIYVISCIGGGGGNITLGELRNAFNNLIDERIEKNKQ